MVPKDEHLVLHEDLSIQPSVWVINITRIIMNV